MKLSLNWIREYVDLPEDLTMEKLSYDLTMRTVEVEGTENLGKALENIVVGKIISVDPHPKADKLRMVTTDVGLGENKVIICGGSNLEPGQLVVVAKPGSYVVWHGVGEPVEIKESKLRGETSWGMICGANEVGLEDLFPVSDESAAEIVDLSSIDCKPGDNISDVLGLNDTILEIDNKSLTNRPDLWGHYGIARELAAIYGKELKQLPKFELDENMPVYPVEIEDSELCRRYIAVSLENVVNEPSPMWLKSALLKVGLRPINNIVDITNYIMLAVGQPTHGFDRTHVSDGIVVRSAKENEKLLLLDGKELNLGPKNLVIADHKQALGLAGIMGGEKDSILPDTKEVILEIANFSPACVRKTTQEFGLRTEASIRYEKGVDTQRVDQAIGLAQKLFKDIIPESKITAFNDNYKVKTEKEVISVSLDFLSRRLGKTVTYSEVDKVLSPLGFASEDRGEYLIVTAPTWRSTGDITLHDDILEEVARMIGYENFEYIAPVVTLDKPIKQLEHQMDRNIKEYLAKRCGYQEVFTYPWTEEEYIKASGIPTDNMIALATPPSPETRLLRSSLVPGLMETIVTNLRYYDEFKVFEATEVFKKGEYSPSVDIEKLPIHELTVAGAAVGPDVEELFFGVKGAIENMAKYTHIEPLGFSREVEPTWAEKKVWLNITTNNEVVGSIGLLSLKSKNAVGIKKGQAVLFEINLDKLKPLPSRTNKFTHLPLFPLVEQDLSILLDIGTPWEDIKNLIEPMVKDIEFIEEYKGKQIPEGKKSVMFRVHFGSDTGTLTTEQIDSKMAGIIKRLTKQFKAEVRGI